MLQVLLDPDFCVYLSELLNGFFAGTSDDLFGDDKGLNTGNAKKEQVITKLHNFSYQLSYISLYEVIIKPVVSLIFSRNSSGVCQPDFTRAQLNRLVFSNADRK